MNRLTKKLLKHFFIWLGITVAVPVLAIACIAGYYHRIVSAAPNNMRVPEQPGELGKWVNTFSGTGGIPYMCAHNFPGVCMPFGMLRLSPETASMLANKRALNTSGYYFGDNKIIGFSHTRLVGTGATDGGHFLVVPGTGDDVLNNYQEKRYHRFSHKNEKAFPGYYAVRLSKPNILAELTASMRTGMHRYSFPANSKAHILIDVSNALGGKRSREGTIQVIPEANEIEGSIRTFGSFAGRYGGLKVYFVAQFDQAFDSFSLWTGDSVRTQQTRLKGDDLGVDLGFSQSASERVIELRVAISHASIANARTNLQAESAGNSFSEIVRKTRQAWEERLSSIRIQGGNEEQKAIFYTALYRSFQMPTVFNDVNGDYLGFDKRVHSAKEFRYFTDLSLWDTFRTTHPLYTLIAPADQQDMLRSLVSMKEQGGWLPRWPSGNGYTNSMLGTPADIVIAESWLKGMRDFDIHTAYEAMKQTALSATSTGAPYSGREGVEYYVKHGYCPAELMSEAVGRTLEFAWADHAISLLADALGHHEDAALFRKHAQFYRNLWNPETQYFQPKTTAGEFQAIKPKLLTYTDRSGEYTNDYVEGSALQWRWAIPFDAPGLISLFRNRDYFVSELNAFFAEATAKLGPWHPGPYYWQGNEPDIHAAYLFNVAGRPDLTQKWLRWILDHKYKDNFVGLDGNDDAGTLSAWYVFSALGLYPIAGTDIYQLGAPLFQKAEVKLAESLLLIVADNYSPEHIYVKRVCLNDQVLDRSWLQHAEIQNGGVLRFEMSEKPCLPADDTD